MNMHTYLVPTGKSFVDRQRHTAFSRHGQYGSTIGGQWILLFLGLYYYYYSAATTDEAWEEYC